MICAACQSSDAALDVTRKLYNLILSGELPRDAFLLDWLLIGLEKPGGCVRPIAVSEMWYRCAGSARCGHTGMAWARARPRCRSG